MTDEKSKVDQQAAARANLPPLKIAVVLGSVRKGRLCDRVAKFVVKHLTDKKHEVTILDPMEHKLPFLERAHHHYPAGEAPEFLNKINDVFVASDAVIVVSAEYNHSIPPALSNFLAHFGGKAFLWKPSGIVTYSAGQFGGARAAMQLRAMLGELGCLSVSNIFAVGTAQTKLDEEGKPTDDSLTGSVSRLITQLEWNAHAMKNARDTFGTP